LTQTPSLDERLAGRYSMRDIIHPLTGEILVKAGDVIDDNVAKRIYLSGVSEVEVRNLFGCISKDGVCVKCYGRNLATGDVVKVGEAVGIMAAQSIGEPGTQLTMRTFHTGGVAGGADITQGLPRVQELFEARNPKGEAIISEIAGEVVEISKDTESGKSNVVVQHVFDKKTKTITSNEIAFENFEYLVGTKFEDHGKTILTGLNEEEVLVEIPGTIVDVSKDETNVTIIINISDNPIKRVNNPVVNVDLKNNSTNKYNVTVKYVEEKAYTTPFN
jgi:DNA-directed RNA polymerase beta' subunit